MSRSIGDSILDELGVSPTPEVRPALGALGGCALREELKSWR
jgi:hypothetical protein